MKFTVALIIGFLFAVNGFAGTRNCISEDSTIKYFSKYSDRLGSTTSRTLSFDNKIVYQTTEEGDALINLADYRFTPINLISDKTENGVQTIVTSEAATIYWHEGSRVERGTVTCTDVHSFQTR